ncbi:MAG: ornithine carbamoyltransferase [Pseudomonadota bacterium]|nr:ornithine carbamoyltransferase [Pseudomonadota bacterium]
MRHFLTLLDLTPTELHHLINRAIELKQLLVKGDRPPLFQHQVMGMVFEKSSTRTRVSFETAMAQGGGHAIFLSPRDTQFGRGEPLEDSARVVSSMVDIIMIRTFGHEKLVEFARASQVPVINALTDEYHPCQLLADMQTYVEHRGSIKGKTVTWVGDGNNMCHSYINAARQFDFHLNVACPKGYEPDAAIVEANKDRVSIFYTCEEAVQNSNLVVTDVWASMGQEEEQKAREVAFKDFQVSRALLDQAADDVLFMHCLPAHRGEEISEDLLEDPRSVVWAEAENRLHAQKALIELLLRESKSNR